MVRSQRRLTKIIAGGLAVASMVATATTDKNLPWQPDQSGRPTPENPTGKEKPALAQVPDACAAALSDAGYGMLAEKLSNLSSNRSVIDQLAKDGLALTNVSWQDVGRSTNSSVGYNISDVRLVAITKTRDGSTKLFPMPIIRLPNFEDKTVDIDLEKVMVPVGNAWGADTFAVPLSAILENLTPFLSFKESIKGSLLAPRDSQVLVSAQASIMPVPRNGQAHFAPSIFNYSSSPGNPAVLVILASNQGTSITIVDNERDGLNANGLDGRGQLLFHNKFGQKAPFTLEALSEVNETEEGRGRIKELESSGQAVAGVSGVNQVLMIQVPLKHQRYRTSYLESDSFGLESVTRGGGGAFSFGPPRGLDTGVVGIANYTLGRFVELSGLTHLERDEAAPIRIDVVRYMASDTADITSVEVDQLPEELRGIYAAGKNLGSLVTDPFARRITRNYRPYDQPWWPGVVLPWLPPAYHGNPGQYFEPIYGINWVYRFGTEDAARAALAELGSAKDD